MGRQQLYCAVQSLSPDHRRMMMKKYSLHFVSKRRQDEVKIEATKCASTTRAPNCVHAQKQRKFESEGSTK